MAVTIQHKRNSTTGNVPTVSDIEQGEIAINLAELYRFCIKELFKANGSIDPEAINNVRALITPISAAWSDMPSSYKSQPPLST